MEMRLRGMLMETTLFGTSTTLIFVMPLVSVLVKCFQSSGRFFVSRFGQSVCFFFFLVYR